MISHIRFVTLIVVSSILATTAISCRQIQPYAEHVETPLPMRIVDADRLQRSRRIAILKFENGTAFRSVDLNVKDGIIAAMRETGTREIVDISDVMGGACNIDTVLRGEYPIQVLADAWRQYHADTVMFARITEFRPFPPLSLGITIHLVDAGDARLLATINHHWTLSDPNVLTDYRSWLSRQVRPPGNPEVYEASPRAFFDFVASQVARGLDQTQSP